MHSATRRLAAEFVGTFVLVFAGCGAALIAADVTGGRGFPVGVGFLGVSIAFGTSVAVLAYAVGSWSGGHFNPAVTVGAATAGRFAWRDVPGYVATQIVGAAAAAAVLWLVLSGRPGFDAVESGFASNGYGDRSPGRYSWGSALLIEVVLTALFVTVILAVTAVDANPAVAPAVIGATLTLIHLVSIPVTNTSVNPARSIGPALFAGAGALGQLWMFVVAPLVGAAVAGFAYVRVFGR